MIDYYHTVNIRSSFKYIYCYWKFSVIANYFIGNIIRQYPYSICMSRSYVNGSYSTILMCDITITRK